jgi:murein L,D-transpeptidase YafK
VLFFKDFQRNNMKKSIVFGFGLVLTLALNVTAQEVPKKQPILHASCSQIENINKMKPVAYYVSNPEPTMIVISKEKSRMYLMQGNQVLRKYRVAFGSNHDEGPKVQEGDRRTPEGIYSIIGKNENSHYHKALKISYPNDYDKAYAAELGVKPGDDIMIHALPSSLEGFMDNMILQSAVNAFNWTAGCVAVTNDQMDIIFLTVPLHTPVAICP